MEYGIITSAVAVIYEKPALVMESRGQQVSAISDEGLCGMLVAVIGPKEQRFFPVRTFYGYTGYLREEDVRLVGEAEARAWEETRLDGNGDLASYLAVTSAFCVDVVSLPRVQGVRLISLFRGSLVRVLFWESEEAGWAQVQLPDGRIGYMRNQYLWEKKFSQAGVWEEKPVQQTVSVSQEEAFRRAVVETAKTYLGIQYRWGGRSTAGIDCSGLTSESYLLNGILTWRDARIVEGYPVHEIPKDQIKPADLLYFPGHIAMYVGDGVYIHSTGRIGSGGVVYNSLRPESPLYRQDLLDSWYAAGSLFG